MNRLNSSKRAQVVAALVDGVGINATARMTDVSKPTVLKLLTDLGAACAAYQAATLRGLTCRRLQVDEIWQFCYAKAKNLPADKQGQFGYGDVWTWVAIDADSKLVPSWRIGPRDTSTAYELMMDLAGRLYLTQLGLAFLDRLGVGLSVGRCSTEHYVIPRPE